MTAKTWLRDCSGSILMHVLLMDRKSDQELRAFAQFAFDVDVTPVVFDNAPRQRQTKAGAVAFGGVKRPEDEREVLGGNTTSIVSHRDEGLVFFRGEDDAYGTWAFNGLHRIQQQIQHNLVHLI